MVRSAIRRRLSHLGFKGNLQETRYGWLRLTPAYSVHLVRELLAEAPDGALCVVDPFCGTGTTALVCAEQGIPCDTTDINPFLLWLTAAKTRTYSDEELAAFREAAREVVAAIRGGGEAWTPPLFQIERWWDPPVLTELALAMSAIRAGEAGRPPAVHDLLLVAFCRTMIERSNASFGHQSMSFRKRAPGETAPRGRAGVVAESWERAVASIAAAAASPVMRAPRALHCDARSLGERLGPGGYRCAITSPPYPNRMSYIRELRPYMYWLGYLRDGREAGALDWQAIGGTWGCATSQVGKWQPPAARDIPFPGFADILEKIARHSPLLSRYVHKYFWDMAGHIEALHAVMAPGGKVHYVVGNSKFYDAMLPVEEIFAALFAHRGFAGVAVRIVRKRSSKKELYEYLVSAVKPAPG